MSEVARVRLGVTLQLNVPVLTDGDEVSLVGRNISAVIVEPKGAQRIMPFTIDGEHENKVKVVFEGAEQNMTGLHRLMIVENLGKESQTLFDIDAVNLVARSSMASALDSSLPMPVVQLSGGSLFVGGKGGEDGVGISTIQFDSRVEGANRYKITLTNGTMYYFVANDGAQGLQGHTPYIQDGYWFINNTSTGVKADFSAEEAARAAAETQRQAQEAQRRQTFAANEAARQTAYQNAEANRDGAYQEAESDRDDLFTAAETQRNASVTAAQTAAQAAAASAADAADDAAEAAQKLATIQSAIDDLDPSQSTDDAVVALAARQGVLEGDIAALGPKMAEEKEELQSEINSRSRFLETEEGVFIIDKQKNIGAKLVDGVFDALGFGSNLTSIIVSLFNSLIGERETELQLVKATENEGINIVDGDGNIVFSLRFSVVEEEGLFLIDDELNIGVQWHDGKWSACETRVPMVDLVPDHTLKDFSTEISNFSFNESDILEQVYEQMDTLVDTYDFVSKVDAADLMGIEYPFYANGVPAQTTYTDAEGVVSTIEPTPAYKIYMYKFEYHKAACGYGTTVPRKKILIVGGVHGNEIAAPANLYLLAKELCKGTDINLFKLFSVFDFYIVPCVNGYGMYHLTRGNARSVNLNRNFPIEKWYLTGKSNITATTNGYTGPTPGSEFETQLIVALTDYIKPDVAIDHHNYSRQDMQFYTEVPEKTLIPVAYKSLADCSCAFVKGLPSYFGTSYNLFKNTTAVTIAAPLGIQRDTEGKTSRWWYENGVDVAAPCEICASINYRNGTYSTNPNYNADAFSVGEYTLRNLLTHYCNYYIKKYINF